MNSLCKKVALLFVRLFALFIPFSSTRKQFRNFCVDSLIDNSFSLNFYLKNKKLNRLDILREYSGNIDFPEYSLPLVSIIISYYNQYEQTLLALAAIYNNTQGVAYEIILADDHSPDDQSNFRNRFSNAKVITTKVNLGFLGNCNNAVPYAKGEFICLLNNDTQVQKGWLEPLLQVITRNHKVGLVGSKLVYPNNILQEAGGIIWNDATGNNYGRGNSPYKEEYCYVKEVDYISGASILLRKRDWERLGGFDEQFQPAYYEDTDLAFRIREDLGLKVIYQPQSVVVHFEGLSHGTDETSGVKKFQVLNREKFLAKWKKVLSNPSKHANPGEFFLARTHSCKKKTVLFIDHGYLSFDADAGSKASFQYLKLMVEMDYNVIFLPASTEGNTKYKVAIQQLGVEVLVFSKTVENWRSWISKNGLYIDYVYANRPSITAQFLDDLKKYTKAKIIYQMHDLHFMREQRRFELEKSQEAKLSFENWQKLEISLIKTVDTVCTFSSYEEAIIKQIDASINVYVLPLFICEFKNYESIAYNPEDRQGLIFVGSYKHTPNIDGAIWLMKEILPQIKQKLPDIHCYICGAFPTKAMLDYTSSGCEVTGYLPDDELEKLYKKVKLAVIPLRFGAGVKGKVIDAILNKIPTVTTSIGLEGLDEVKDHVCKADSINDFCEAVVNLYSSNHELKKKSQESYNKLKMKYSKAETVSLLNSLMPR